MEDSQFASDVVDWDWEVLLVHHSDNHHLQHNPNLRSLANSVEEDEEGRESSFPDDDVIHSDYFSIGSDHRQNRNSEVQMETAFDFDASKQDSRGDDIQFGSESWMDPSQFSSTERVGKKRRNYSSCSSEESSDISGGVSGDSSGSDPHNHLLILQPHSGCTQHPSCHVHSLNPNCQEGFSGNSIEPFDTHSKCQLEADPPLPLPLLAQDDGHGIQTGFEISHSLCMQSDPQFHKDAQPQKEEDVEDLPHGAVQNSPSSGIRGDRNKDIDKDVDMNMGIQEAKQEERDIKSSPEIETRSVAWWKVPLEVLKYCVLRVSPVWSLSVAAAALMGFVFLRRRWLSKMKRKTQGLHLNITVDDKKVSQFMTRTARLNEAFSVVKRVPIVRPSLPAPGLAPWPVVSLR